MLLHFSGLGIFDILESLGIESLDDLYTLLG